MLACGPMNEGVAPAAASTASPPSPVRLANLNTFNPKTSLHFADTYVFRGTSPQQRPFGELFVVLQIDHGTRTSAQVADAIATILQHEYYRGNPNESAKNFEDALHKTNEILSDLAARGEIHWIGKMHGVIAVIQRDSIHVSATGRGKAYLVRGSEIADIAEGLYDASRPASPMKSFEHLASGELSDGDIVLLSTPGISELINPQQLRQLLRGNAPSEAAAEIQSRVGHDPAAANSGIVIRYDRRSAPAVQQAPVRPAAKTRTAPRPPTPTVVTPPPTKVAATPTPVVASAPRKPSLLDKTRASIKTFQERRAARKRAPSDEPATTSAAPNTSPGQNKLWQAVRTVWGKFPRRGRFFALLAVVLVFVFVVSLFVFNNTRKSSVSREVVTAKLNQAKDLEQQVGAAIIFKDFTQAQTLLQQAVALLGQVPSDASTKDQIATLTAAIASDHQKLSGDTKVEPKVLASLEGKGDLAGLSLVNGKLIVWTSAGNVEIVPTSGGQPATAESIKGSLGTPGVGTADENRAVVLTSKGALVALDNGKTDPLDVSGTFTPGAGASLTTYGSRLYVLDPNANKITRHSRTVAGYSGSSSWIGDNTSVRDAVDLTVDGDLWILRKDGTVTKMTQGLHQDFTLGKPQDPLTSPTRIVTAEGDTFLYVLDPAKHRLLQFEKKTGDFVKQYTADSFGTLTDVVVNEKGHTAFLLSGSQVVKIDLQS